MLFVKGDILQSTTGLIIHGCNAQGVMGSGLALQIRTKYPAVFDAYKKIPKGDKSLGIFQCIHINDDLAIGNCITQLYYGREQRKYADLGSIRESLEAAFMWCSEFGKELNAPEIGCGLGGLQWSEVEPIFLELNAKYPEVTVKIYRLK